MTKAVTHLSNVNPGDDVSLYGVLPVAAGGTGLTEISLDSGSITPTATGTTNVASCSGDLCQYARVLDSVVYSGLVNVTPAVASSAVVVRLALPIASNFTNAKDVGGPLTTKAIGSPVYETGQVQADVTNDELLLLFYPSTTALYNVRFSVVYPIK